MRLDELDVPAFLELSQLLRCVMLDECGLVKLTGIVVHNAVGPLGASETLVLGRHPEPLSPWRFFR